MPNKKSAVRKKHDKLKASLLEKNSASRSMGSSLLAAYGDMSRVPANFDMECSECKMVQKNRAFCYFCHAVQRTPACAHCGRMKCSGMGTDCLIKHPGNTVTGIKFVGAICDFCEAFVCHSRKCIQEHACACPFRESAEPGSLSIKCSECQRDVWSHGGKMYQCHHCNKWNCQDDQFEHQAMCQVLDGENFKCISCNKRGQWSCMRCKISYCDIHVMTALNVIKTGQGNCDANGASLNFRMYPIYLLAELKKHEYGRQGTNQGQDNDAYGRYGGEADYAAYDNDDYNNDYGDYGDNENNGYAYSDEEEDSEEKEEEEESEEEQSSS